MLSIIRFIIRNPTMNSNIDTEHFLSESKSTVDATIVKITELNWKNEVDFFMLTNDLVV